jgi:hypothetical protein
MIESSFIPYVWLGHDADYPALFGYANGGYAALIFFEGDTRRLAASREDMFIMIIKGVYKIVTRLKPPDLKPPDFRRALHELHFLKKDLDRLPEKAKREAIA